MFKIQDSRFVLVPSFSLITCLFRTERGKIKIYNSSSGGYFIFYLDRVSFYSVIVFNFVRACLVVT